MTEALSFIDLKGPFDDAFVHQNEHIFSLFLLKKDIVYKIKLESYGLMNGKLVGIGFEEKTIRNLFEDVIACNRSLTTIEYYFFFSSVCIFI